MPAVDILGSLGGETVIAGFHLPQIGRPELLNLSNEMGQCSIANHSPVYSPRPSLVHRVGQALLVVLGTQREKKTQTLAQKAALWEGKERSGEKVATMVGSAVMEVLMVPSRHCSCLQASGRIVFSPDGIQGAPTGNSGFLLTSSLPFHSWEIHLKSFLKTLTNKIPLVVQYIYMCFGVYTSLKVWNKG